jgi:hypothetical protein
MLLTRLTPVLDVAGPKPHRSPRVESQVTELAEPSTGCPMWATLFRFRGNRRVLSLLAAKHQAIAGSGGPYRCGGSQPLPSQAIHDQGAAGAAPAPVPAPGLALAGPPGAHRAVFTRELIRLSQ